ncbi:MAG: hypothetical protein GYA65_14230, partial [Actinobacteria bacterium]|nr:hypothetical protein [Actinomycetota bacterium]
MFEAKITEVAIGQIRGLVKPSDKERQAAFDLFIELASRTTTTPLTPTSGLIREALNSLYAMFAITREVLRTHGCDVANSRHDGNLTLAAIALRVLNEVIRPSLSTWHPELSSWEEKRATEGAGTTSVEWERAWPQAAECRADLNALRAQIRAYIDSLAQIAGTPSLTDLVVPVPAGAPGAPVVL